MMDWRVTIKLITEIRLKWPGGHWFRIKFPIFVTKRSKRKVRYKKIYSRVASYKYVHLT
jgi:hypothetical protein